MIIMDHVTKRWPGSTCSLHVKHEGESCLEVTMIRDDMKEKLIYSRKGGDPKHLHHSDIGELFLDRIEQFLNREEKE
jgi:hypothetical protein